MRLVILLSLLWVKSAFAEIVSLETIQDWVQSIRRAEIVQINGKFEPIYTSEDAELPIEYQFILSEPDSSVNFQLTYIEYPHPKIFWNNQVLLLEDIHKRWGANQDTMPLSLDTVEIYNILIGKQTYTCLEGNFSGLGMSGSMQFYKAVLVLEAELAIEKLYFSGRYAGCYLVGDYTGEGQLGYMQLKHFSEKGIIQAEVRVLKYQHGQSKAVRAYSLIDNYPARPLALDEFGKLPE